MTVASLAAADLVEERRAALADVALLYAEPKVPAPGVRLLRPFGFDATLLQLHPNALRKRRDESKPHLEEPSHLRRPQHGQERAPTKVTEPVVDHAWGAWPPAESQSFRSGFPLSDDGFDDPVIQVPPMPSSQESEKISELQEEVSRLKEAMKAMQMGSRPAIMPTKGSSEDWWDDPIGTKDSTLEPLSLWCPNIP
eukprot:5589664-Amphidinium_carterae.2